MLKKTCVVVGFVGEMRAVAMKLHTREQAPKEGGIEAPKRNKPVSMPYHPISSMSSV